MYYSMWDQKDSICCIWRQVRRGTVTDSRVYDVKCGEEQSLIHVYMTSSAERNSHWFTCIWRQVRRGTVTDSRVYDVKCGEEQSLIHVYMTSSAERNSHWFTCIWRQVRRGTVTDSRVVASKTKFGALVTALQLHHKQYIFCFVY